VGSLRNLRERAGEAERQPRGLEVAPALLCDVFRPPVVASIPAARESTGRAKQDQLALSFADGLGIPNARLR
jgi:hypothetical protein